tara:strand:- start:324 stop:854 length:531 start_codon:yes stop_codon:yes gene_type:complete
MTSDIAVFDLIIAALVITSAIYGLYRGLIRELISLIAWVLAFFLAILFSPNFANLLDPTWAGETLRLIFSFSAIFVGVLIVSSFIQFIVRKFLSLVGLGSLDRFLGMVFGIARGVVISTILLVLFIELFPTNSWAENSKVSTYLLAYESLVVDLLGVAKSSVDNIPDLDPGLNPDL